MTPRRHRSSTRLALGAVALATLNFASSAHAANQALIMTLDYSGTATPLPAAGVEADGRMAKEIAVRMGVPENNIVWLRNQALTLDGMNAALQNLVTTRVHEGDKVFLYYSGHGAQFDNTSGSASKCSEAMVSVDLKAFGDAKVEAVLAALSAKASQVVVMNDSCYSGGQATKGLNGNDGEVEVVKRYVPAAAQANSGAYHCDQPVNRALSRTLAVVDKRTSTRMLYVAAAADNEASVETRLGSAATLAWHHCLTDRSADRDGNGIIDGDELRSCAQRVIDAAGRKHHQTITLVGDSHLPLSFTAASSDAGNAPVLNPAQTLETLRQAADPSIEVDIAVANPRLKIKRDLLDFSVRTGRAGYLYLLHVSADGKFVQLFPNAKDADNRLAAGTYRFPRPTWGIQAQGPAGTGYLMAYLSSSPRNFAKGMGVDGPFAAGQASEGVVRALGITALDGRFGASSVATVEEVK